MFEAWVKLAHDWKQTICLRSDHFKLTTWYNDKFLALPTMVTNWRAMSLKLTIYMKHWIEWNIRTCWKVLNSLNLDLCALYCCFDIALIKDLIFGASSWCQNLTSRLVITANCAVFQVYEQYLIQLNTNKYNIIQIK